MGGDDFIVIFSDDHWQEQCQAVLDQFAHQVRQFYTQETLQAGGVWGSNRQGEKVFHPVLSLSVGVVDLRADQGLNHHQVAELAALAKKSAKQQGGNHLYIQPYQSAYSRPALQKQS